MVKELQVINHEGQLVTDSRDVAEMVNKRHDHLLADIKRYSGVLDSQDFGSANFFIQHKYYNSQNKEMPCFLLTRKGCDMVANKMTGEKGILFTATYVTRFEEMENALKSQVQIASYMIDDPIQRAEKWIEEQREKQQLQLQNSTFKQQIGEMKPKVSYYDVVLKSPSAMTVTEISKDYGMSANKFNQLLHGLGIQYKQGKVWFLYSKYHDKGYTKTETYTYDEDKTRISTKWTQK